jgi:hypothetical protein
VSDRLGLPKSTRRVASRLHAEHLGGDRDFGLYERQDADAIIGLCDEA